jgi:hypothetical protein
MKTTHPDIAALVTPLYASRKEGEENSLCFYLINPRSSINETRAGSPVKENLLINNNPSKSKTRLNPLSAAGEERSASEA